MPLRRNILLFHQGALGDFIITWPLALGIARVLAQSRIFYITTSEKGALAERALRVESADVEAGWHHLFSADPRPPDAPTRLLNGAQYILAFGAAPASDDLWIRNLRALSPEATLVPLSTTPPDDFQGHITHYLLRQLSPHPILFAAMDQMLKSVAARGIGTTAPSPAGPILLHPGAGSAKKCWPPDQYLALAKALKETGHQVQFLLGEVEREKWPPTQIDAFSSTAEVINPPTLLDLMSHLTGASAFIGNDSGPGHLAAILGLPTLSLFGPNSPARWRPLGPNVQVLHHAWPEITPSTLLRLLPK